MCANPISRRPFLTSTTWKISVFLGPPQRRVSKSPLAFCPSLTFLPSRSLNITCRTFCPLQVLSDSISFTFFTARLARLVPAKHAPLGTPNSCCYAALAFESASNTSQWNFYLRFSWSRFTPYKQRLVSTCFRADANDGIRVTFAGIT
jgi:hypothetical protein